MHYNNLSNYFNLYKGIIAFQQQHIILYASALTRKRNNSLTL